MLDYACVTEANRKGVIGKTIKNSRSAFYQGLEKLQNNNSTQLTYKSFLAFGSALFVQTSPKQGYTIGGLSSTEQLRQIQLGKRKQERISLLQITKNLDSCYVY